MIYDADWVLYCINTATPIELLPCNSMRVHGCHWPILLHRVSTDIVLGGLVLLKGILFMYVV